MTADIDRVIDLTEPPASPVAQRVFNGSRAALLSIAARHAYGALRVGRIDEAIAVLEDVLDV